MLLNMNQTGGTPKSVPPSQAGLLFDNQPGRFNVTVYTGEGLKPSFNVANADDWEGGRGERCEFWRRIGPRVPM